MTNTTHTIQTITATGLAAIMALGLTACMDGIEHPENYPTNGSKKITATSNPQDTELKLIEKNNSQGQRNNERS